MGKFTEIELQDLIDGGDDFTRQLATQCLGAERQLRDIGGSPRYMRMQQPHKYGRFIYYDAVEEILNRSNDDE